MEIISSGTPLTSGEVFALVRRRRDERRSKQLPPFGSQVASQTVSLTGPGRRGNPAPSSGSGGGPSRKAANRNVPVSAATLVATEEGKAQLLQQHLSQLVAAGKSGLLVEVQVLKYLEKDAAPVYGPTSCYAAPLVVRGGVLTGASKANTAACASAAAAIDLVQDVLPRVVVDVTPAAAAGGNDLNEAENRPPHAAEDGAATPERTPAVMKSQLFSSLYTLHSTLPGHLAHIIAARHTLDLMDVYGRHLELLLFRGVVEVVRGMSGAGTTADSRAVAPLGCTGVAPSAASSPGNGEAATSSRGPTRMLLSDNEVRQLVVARPSSAIDIHRIVERLDERLGYDEASVTRFEQQIIALFSRMRHLMQWRL